MKARPVFLIAISAVLGLFAVFLVRGMVKEPVQEATDTQKVVVASIALSFGDQLTATNLRLVDFLPASVPEGAFHSVAELTDGQPRLVLNSMQPGEIVLASKISGRGAKASLSSVIDPGKRAVTVRVDDVSGAAGFITPSDRVDVMLTRTSQGQSFPQTEVLLQDIKVLAVDQLANERNDRPVVAKAVTLEVTPTDAEKIALGRSIGVLSLSLRNFTSAAGENTPPISVNDLTGVLQAPPEHIVEIIRGSGTPKK